MDRKVNDPSIPLKSRCLYTATEDLLIFLSSASSDELSLDTEEPAFFLFRSRIDILSLARKMRFYTLAHNFSNEYGRRRGIYPHFE